jgi:hypothetical protein
MKCQIIKSNTGQIVYFTVASFVSLVTLGVAITFLVLRYGQPELYVGLITNVLAFWAKPPKFEGFIGHKEVAPDNSDVAKNNNDLELGKVYDGHEIDITS